MSLFDDADRSLSDTDRDGGDDTTETPPEGRTGSLGDTYRTQIRGATVEVDGDEVDIAEPKTKQPTESGGNWFTSNNKYGIPRGTQAIKQRRIAQTSAMQSIANGITDQLLGGDLAFLDDEDAMDNLSESERETAGTLKTILRDVLTGPHMGDEDLDDLVAAAVEDMLGPGNAYLQLLAPQSGDLPVVSLSTLDPLTIRHNVTDNGFPKTPPYWQAAGQFGSGSVGSTSVSDPVPLQSDDVAVLRYPKGNRSYRIYPVSASWQVKEWLEILADSTTHHKRYYDDNEVPPGLMQVVDASDQTISDIQNQVEQAAGDPRDFPIVGGEAPANWVEMGGTAINLDIIQEQQWFFKMCLGSLGLGKQELGFIEDVNRSNGEVEAERVIKRVAGPFGKQFEQAFLHIARQFDAFGELGEPFTPTLANTDMRAKIAKEERLTEQLQAGAITPREFARRTSNEDIAEDDDRWEVEINGETINYGNHPQWVSKRLMSAAGATDPDDPDGVDGEQSRSVRAEDEPPFTDYPEAAVENAKMALDARDDTDSDCGTDAGWRTANVLANREGVSRDLLGDISSFSRFEEDKEMDPDEGRADCGWQMWKAWGGDEGIAWAERKLDQIEGE